MSSYRLRWAHLCVVTALGALQATSAEAERKVVIGPCTTLDGLAREYHVSKTDIAKANGITPEALLVDGRTLTIPDPPPSVTAPATMATPATIKGNRIGLRIGPGTTYRRDAMLDHGARVKLTAQRNGWFQLRTSDGKQLWVRADFVSATGAAVTATAQSSSPKTTVAAGKTKPVQKSASAAPKPAAVGSKPLIRCVKGDRVALRAKPDSAGERLALVDDGAVLKVMAKASGWCKVSLLDGKTGWIRGDFVAMSSRVGRSATQLLADRRAGDASKPRTRQASTGTQRSSGRRLVRHSKPESPAPRASGDVIRTAYSYRGSRYRYGGSSSNGFDCSGFTSHVYGRKGVSLPHNAAAQFGRGASVSKGSLKPGDLVFFSTGGRRIGHVGIYAGDGKFVHSSSARGRVRVDSLNSGFYKQRYRGARRVR